MCWYFTYFNDLRAALSQTVGSQSRRDACAFIQLVAWRQAPSYADGMTIVGQAHRRRFASLHHLLAHFDGHDVAACRPAARESVTDAIASIIIIILIKLHHYSDTVNHSHGEFDDMLHHHRHHNTSNSPWASSMAIVATMVSWWHKLMMRAC